MILVYPRTLETILLAQAHIGIAYDDDQQCYTTKYRWDSFEKINPHMTILPAYIDIIEMAHNKQLIVLITKEGYYTSGIMFYKADVVLHYRKGAYFIMRDRFDNTLTDDFKKYSVWDIEEWLTFYKFGSKKEVE